MTFEERIDRLTVRHEALTQSVEMMRQDMQKQDERLGKLIGALETDGEHIRSLSRIAEIDQRRISDIEDGNA